MEWIYPLIIAVLSFGVNGLLLVRYLKTKDRSTRDWSLAFFFHGLSYVLATVFVGEWFVFSETAYFFTQFLRQTFVTLLFIAIYLGIIRLLTTKKSLTVYFPVAFLCIQTILLLYFDFFLHDVSLADQMHIIFFDVPFNMIIAVVFLKFYLVSKKMYSLLISIAWFGYTATVPIFFYTYGNTLLFTISLLPMLVMLIAFIFYYQSPTGQAILDVMPVVERKSPPPTKYKLKPGSTYTIEEEKSRAAFEVFTDSVFHGVRGLCVTRTIPTDVRATFELKKTPVLWLTHIHNDFQVVDPNELEQLVALVDKFVANSKQEFEREAIDEENKPSLTTEQNVHSGAHDEKKGVPESVKKVEPQKDTPSIVQPSMPKKSFVIHDIGMDEKKAEVPREESQKPIVQPSEQLVKPFGALDLGRDEKAKSTNTPAKSQRTESPAIKQPVRVAFPKFEPSPLLSNNSSKLLTEQPSTPPAILQNDDNILATLMADSRPLSQIIPPQIKPSVNDIVDSFKARAEDTRSLRDKEWEANKAKIVKKNKLGFTVIGEDEEVSAKTEHSANFEVLPDSFHKSVIVIDGLEYLINNNNFNSVLHVLQLMKDKISMCDSVLILPINPLTMDEQHISILRGELEIYEPEKNLNQ